ncbi:zinc metallopeptidase [Vagococcus silagei]|uniref:Zinc metallopeptidase n=1 Tax=Vagococcus silagei TaxID=2508885 RepID=A0A4S3B5C4_9ENTE|nr:zinc metallopeptidase [Vagococcus silagei]THB62321.1 zinc metallopeptidase [Vagococcus silagei]
MFFYPMFDPTYVLVIIGMLISMAASAYVSSTYRKYEKVQNCKGYTGEDVARMILRGAGIKDVSVYQIGGDLTDNYNSHTKRLNLSETTHSSTSVAAIGVAAHECGHAVQDKVGYMPLKLRAGLVPVVNFGATVSIPLIIFGAIFFSSMPMLVTIGIWCFALTFIFQVVTLPVEFNASRRALAILSDNQILSEEELAVARKVLIAAALTYVAAAISSLLQLLRLVILFGNRRD